MSAILSGVEIGLVVSAAIQRERMSDLVLAVRRKRSP
jgi:hypothetical protein